MRLDPHQLEVLCTSSVVRSSCLVAPNMMYRALVSKRWLCLDTFLVKN